MNFKYKIIALFAMALLSACGDDYFESKENQYLTNARKEELKKESPESVVLLIEGSLNGIYNNLISFQTSHDDFGLKAFMLAGDETGLDVVQVKHHWFGFDYNFENRQAPYRRTRTMWKVFYKQISSANIILNDYFSDGEPENDNLLHKKAETRALRGVAYYYLINLYQQNYIGNQEKPGVPLLLSVKDENMPRESVENVYKQLIADLKYGVENNISTPDVKDVDRNVAATYLAKAYAAQQKWDSVAYYSNIAIENKPLTDSNTILSGKWDSSSASWLWGYGINGETTTLYASFYSHMDNTIGGYAGGLGVYRSIYSNLYDKISDTDVRKKIFVNSDLFPDIASQYPALPKYASLKYVTSNDFTGDYCFVRVEDPYLLLAEAYAEQGRLLEAKQLLSNLMKLRDDSYSVDKFNSKDDIIEEVRLQRRIELWGEGTSFYDLKRWNLGVDRTVPGSNHRTKIVVPAGDKKWVYQIPQNEFDSNPNIGEQNP